MFIDLHWKINNRQILARTYDVSDLYANGLSLQKLAADIRIPNEVDSLLIACLHRLGHHHSEERLAWLYDIHVLANKLDDKHWQSLISKAKEKQLSSITLDALELCSRLFKTQIPNNFLDSIIESAKLDEPSQIFLQRDLSPWRYFWHDLKSIDGVGGKLAFLKETIFPDANYVRARMGTKWILLAYVKRLAKGLRRIF